MSRRPHQPIASFLLLSFLSFSVNPAFAAEAISSDKRAFGPSRTLDQSEIAFERSLQAIRKQALISKLQTENPAPPSPMPKIAGGANLSFIDPNILGNASLAGSDTQPSSMPAAPPSARIYSWYASVQAQSALGLVETYPNDPNIVDQGFTYSQATAGKVMLSEGDTAGAKKIFDFFYSKWDGEGFYTVYNTQSVNGAKIEYVRRMGESALFALFSLHYWKTTGDARGLDLATKVGKWITFLPHRDGGVAMGADAFWGNIYSVENNLDYYALTSFLAVNAVKASDKSFFANERDRLKTWFKTKAYDATSGLFRRSPTDPSLIQALDSNSWGILSIGVATIQNELGINVDGLIARAEQKFVVQNNGSFGGDVLSAKGFDFSDSVNALASGRGGIKWVEGTAEMISVYREMERYYTEEKVDAQKASYYGQRADYFAGRLSENKVEAGATLSYVYTDAPGAKVWLDNPYWYASSGPAADSTAWTYFSENRINFFLPSASQRQQPSGYSIIITSNSGVLPQKANGPFTVKYKEGPDGTEKTLQLAFPQGAVNGQSYTFTVPNTRQDAAGKTGSPLDFQVIYDTIGYPIIIVSNAGAPPTRANKSFTVRYKEGQDGAEKDITFNFPAGAVDGQSYAFTIPNTRADEIGNVDPARVFNVIYDITGYAIVVTSSIPTKAQSSFEVRYKEGQDGAEKTATFNFPQSPVNGQAYTFTLKNTRADEIGNIGPDYTFSVIYEATVPPGQPVYAWYKAVQAQSPLGLIETYPNDPNIVDQGFTYSQASAGRVMLNEGDTAGAKKIFDFYFSKWDGDGFFTVYNTQSSNGSRIESVRRMGENALFALFSLQYWKKTGDARGLDLATKIGKWITFLPHRDGGVAMGADAFWGNIYSVENNLDYYALAKYLADNATKPSDKSFFANERDRLKTWFRTKAYDPVSGLFRRAPSDAGIVQALDSNTWAILSIGVATIQNEFNINVDSLIARAEQKFAVQNNGSFGGNVLTAKGFDFSDQTNAQISGRGGIKWVEGTAEMISVYREMERYYTQTKPDATKAAFYRARADYFNGRLSENAVQTPTTLSYTYTDAAGAKVWFDNPFWYSNSGPAADSTAWVYFSQNSINFFRIE